MIKAHRYRAKNLPEIALFGSGIEVQRYTAQIVSRKSLFWDQVQRYKGKELEISSYFSDLLEFLVKIDQGTKVLR